METHKNNQNFVFNAFDLIRFAWDKKWILIILSVIAFILSIIYSLNITPRYKSEVVLFPASAVSLSKNLLETYSISMDNRDILTFGVDDDAERMMQILHSNQIKDHIAEI
jgi:LPS O-antigen subunit length determinant protein (WzzB/FepE family)